ncbi:MAG: hypothetical protein Q8R36_02445 [bacterium]|nr:hypothetical protein [bacterium]
MTKEVVVLRRQKTPLSKFAGKTSSLLQELLQDVPEAITQLEEAKARMQKLDRELAHRLGLPDVQEENIFTRVARFISREKQRRLGGEDPLVVLEENMRATLNSTQHALGCLAVAARDKHKELNEMENSLARAEEEKWSAEKLQAYIADTTGIVLSDEVRALLNEEFALLPEHEIGVQRTALVAQLKGHVRGGKQLMDVLSKTCRAGLEIFHTGQRQYYDYMQVQRPVMAIRDAATTLTEVDESMLLSRAAVVATFQTSIQAIGNAVDAARAIQTHLAISSEDVIASIVQGGRELEGRLLELQEASASPPELSAPQEDASVSA